MPKYRVQIPEPSSARFTAHTVSVYYEDGWSGGWEQKFRLAVGQAVLDFEVPDDTPWAKQTEILDGPSFEVCVEYVNSTRSRREKKWLEPVLMRADQ
jgi:hypothetical protein